MAEAAATANARLASEIAEELAPLIDDDKELFAAIAAIVISLVALVAAMLGVIQQYFASAESYNYCDTKVMSGWAQTRHRKLKLKDFRIEVQYEAPVIFICRPDYTGDGPGKGGPVIMLKGDAKSRADSWTTEEEEAVATTDGSKEKKSRRAARADKQREIEAIHTADNDLATWVTLLRTIQNMESRSQAWQDNWFNSSPPKGRASLPTQEQMESVHNNRTLIVAMKKKKKSYDTMPAGIKKPYATTTWCHLIELMALLGIYWVEFDRISDRYRAEGNGFVVTGNKVNDLGVMFSFQMARAHQFESNRIIPTQHVKDLAFGMVATVYNRASKNDDRRLNNHEQQDITMLHFATSEEIAESLVVIGCNTNAVNYFARKDHEDKRTAHLFPLAFEIVGMLGKTFHIENSGFRYLPNPTMEVWDDKNFSLRDILRAYLQQMNAKGVLESPKTNIKGLIRRWGAEILSHVEMEDQGAWPSFMVLNALHDTLENTDTILTGTEKGDRPRMPSRQATKYSQDLHFHTKSVSPEPETDSPEQLKRRTLVQDVLRSHIQEVLSGLNRPPATGRPGPASNDGTLVDEAEGNSPFTARKPRFEDMDSATPEEKQGKLMEVYFQVIRRAVVKSTSSTIQRRRESMAPGYANFVPGRLARSSTAKTVMSQTLEVDEDGGGEQSDGTDMSLENDTVSDLASDASTEDIWCTLVFRMICWLMLHKFNKKDVQRPKTELHGSRLCVYIA